MGLAIKTAPGTLPGVFFWDLGYDSPMFPRFVALWLMLSAPLSGGIEDDWFDPAFIEANTLKGGTGFISVPSPEVIPGGVLSASIHRYQVKLDYGLWDTLEVGITADLDGYLLEDVERNQILYARARLLSHEKHGVGLSLGVDGVGPEDLGLKSIGLNPSPRLELMERLYAVTGLPLPFYPSMMITAGWGSGAMPAHWFVNISKVLIPGLLLMAEYDGFGSNYGARFLLSERIKLDLDFINVQGVYSDSSGAKILNDHIRFGITYSEPWSSGLASLLPSRKDNAAKTETRR